MKCMDSTASIRPRARAGRIPFPPVAHSRVVGEIVEQLRAQGLHPSPLPLGLRENCIFCNTCNSFPCKIHAKSDADVCAVRPATAESERVAVDQRDRAPPDHRCRPARRSKRSRSNAAATIEKVSAPLVIVSCGAVNSAALLLRSATDKHPDGLANSSGLVGKRYMAHLATMMQGFHPFRTNDTVFQKTVAINDFYWKGPDGKFPLGQIQSQGRTHGVMAQTVVPQVPVWAYEMWVARGVDWLAMTRGSAAAREQGHDRTERRRSGCTTSPTMSARTRRWFAKPRRSCASWGSGS